MDEGYCIIKALNLLNTKENKKIIQLMKSNEEIYLYQQLLNRVMTLKPVSKILSVEEEELVKFFI